jgi:curved DNA binding protein
MSKKVAKTAVVPAAEEEWEDVDENEEVEEEKEEEDETLTNPEVVNKYKKAAQWANETLQHVITLCVAGAKITDVCKAGDAFIETVVKKMFRGVNKGIGFPTTLSVNNCVAYFSLVPGDEGSDVTLALNDVVKIDLGVHVDGYCSQVAHTIQITANGELNPESKEALIITAAQAVLDIAVRNLRPGMDPYAITDIIEKATAHFGFNHVEGVLSHQTPRFILDNFHCIAGKSNAEQKVHSYEIAPMTVWAMDVVLTTGKGKLREGDAKCGIFKPSIDSRAVPKLAAAQEVTKEIDAKFEVFPFAIRNIEHKKARLAMAELTKMGNMHRFAPLYEKEGETVAHFKITVLVTDKKIERITGIPVQKGAAPVKPYESDELKAAAAQKFTLVEKKKAEAKQ